MLIAGCGQAATTPGPSPATAALSQPQPFNLFTHCGILTTYFAGRTFYLAELYPARVLVAGDPGRPEVPGTMTLLSPHVAAFADRIGNRVLFVDELPGALNMPYPFFVRVMSGGNQLSDEQFAGRHWHTADPGSRVHPTATDRIARPASVAHSPSSTPTMAFFVATREPFSISRRSPLRAATDLTHRAPIITMRQWAS